MSIKGDVNYNSNNINNGSGCVDRFLRKRIVLSIILFNFFSSNVGEVLLFIFYRGSSGNLEGLGNFVMVFWLVRLFFFFVLIVMICFFYSYIL